MFSTAFTLIAVTLLCLSFRSTRFIGFIGLVSLVQRYPLHFAAMLVFAGVAFYFSQRN